MIFVGVDVQKARGVAWAALDERHRSVRAGVLTTGSDAEVARQLLEKLSELGSRNRIQVGIDAPRMPLRGLRKVHWSSAHDEWRSCAPRSGRHCEIVVRAAGLANPQWTPTTGSAPAWMRLGFALFKSCEGAGYAVHEVFPSASYRQLRESDATIGVNLRAFGKAPKDVLDAYVAAYTVGEFVVGRGCEIGGGDGLGTIVLPRRLADDVRQGVRSWPGR